MSKNKILILKNDRAGDLFTSLPFFINDKIIPRAVSETNVKSLLLSERFTTC